MKNRVVITGFGLLSPIGNAAPGVVEALRMGRSGIRAMNEWTQHRDLHTRVAGLVEDVDEKGIPREFRRSMGRVAILAARAVGDAVKSAALDRDLLTSGRCGTALGQTVGSPSATEAFFRTLDEDGIRSLKSTAFLQVMAHSVAANVALMFGIRGRTWAPAAACASSSQAIGQAFETLRAGHQDVIIAGGSEELHYTTAATFDILGGTSRGFNDEPTKTPRPFDARRDGLVVSEGAGAVVLERLEHALSRKAPILGEVVGFSSLCDGTHMSAPSREGMAKTMAMALENAGLKTTDIDYINAHATATRLGDATETQATHDVFGDDVSLSSTKGHTGHTLAACGVLEFIFCLLMMKHRFVAPTLNLDQIDPLCSKVRHVQETEERALRRAMSNNFAFGGINTSLVLCLYE